jgi:spermidine synthase
MLRMWQWQNRRLEQIFFEHCNRWLKPAGVLVMVVPGDRLSVFGRDLAFHFKEKRAYRLGTPEALKYK